MKHLRVTATPNPELVPEVYAIVSPSGPVSELRVLDWNVVPDDVGTFLYAIDGDATAFREAARNTRGVDSITISNASDSISYALLEARSSALPFFDILVRMVARAGMILRQPLVYRSRSCHAHVVGKPGPLQSMFDEVADSIDFRIRAIGRFPSAVEDRASQLTSRQREVLETALAMGYYEQPRGITHEDIADELECGTSTVTEHLQKAEDTLVRSALTVEGRHRG